MELYDVANRGSSVMVVEAGRGRIMIEDTGERDNQIRIVKFLIFFKMIHPSTNHYRKESSTTDEMFLTKTHPLAMGESLVTANTTKPMAYP